MASKARLAAVVAVVGLVVGPLATTALARVPSEKVAPQKSAVFAGYNVSKSKAVTSASVTFVVPKITCKKNQSGVGPSVNLISSKGSFSGAGVGVICNHKQPLYQAIVIIAGQATDDFALAAKDRVTVDVKVTKHKTSVTVHDLTSKAHKTLTGKGAVMSFAEIGVQGISQGSRTFGVDPFTKTTFTGALVDGHSLTKEHAFASERVHGKVVQITASKIHKGKDFSVSFKHS